MKLHRAGLLIRTQTSASQKDMAISSNTQMDEHQGWADGYCWARNKSDQKQ